MIQQKQEPNPIFDQVRRQQLTNLVNQTPHATLQELKASLAMPVSICTIWWTLQDMKLTLKKVPPHGRAAGVAGARCASAAGKRFAQF